MQKKPLMLVLGDFMKINIADYASTHEGGKAVFLKPYDELKRTVLACMLFEDSYYESGSDQAKRIQELCSKLSALQICTLALEASQKYHLRHIPLFLIVQALKHPDKHTWFSDTIFSIIKRPDQMTDLLALYWKEGKKPLPHQLKKGLAKSFQKFDRYQLAKYNRNNPIKLRDILFLVHPKPLTEQQAKDWKDLANKTLESPDTWEVRLSAGEEKKKSFEELLKENKLGKLAILRNVRNMYNSGISKELVNQRLSENPKEMLPFQYLAAAKECPQWEDIIDKAMVKACSIKQKLKGNTIVLVDVSGSMDHPLSEKSKMNRFDAACGMAILLKECCENVFIYSFSLKLIPIPPRHGMALRDAIISSQYHMGTYLGGALKVIKDNVHGYERIIVITDEQSHDDIPHMNSEKNYILNIAGYKNGVGNTNQWTTITGFSESSIDYIRELEELITQSL